MRHSDHEQRQMDVASGEELDRRAERKRRWLLKWHYACEACGWFAKKSDFEIEPKTCPQCGRLPSI